MSILCIAVDEPFAEAVARRLHELGLLAGVTSYDAGMLQGLSPPPPVVVARRLFRVEDLRLAFPGVTPIPPSRETLRALAEAERGFLEMSDRFLFAPTPVGERLRLYHELVAWLDGFLAARPDITALYFPSTPHHGWDIVLYHLARLRGRRTLSLHRTTIADRVYLAEDFREPPRPAALPSLAEAQAALGPELLAQIQGVSDWVRLSIAKNKDALGAGRSAKAIVKALRDEAWWLKKRIRHAPDSADRFINAFAGEGALGPAEVWRRKMRFQADIRALRRRYDALARPLDPGRPYVYFALQYQPERTSQPEGLEFADQILVAQLLARALPDGWTLAIKEHPRQLGVTPPAMHRRHARGPADYEALAALPNVRLLPLDAPSEALIDGARACATLTGTVGWEALLQGVPALVFGAAWYGCCEGVAQVGSVEDIRAALARFEGRGRDQIRADMIRFVAGLLPDLIVSSNDHRFATKSAIAYDRLVATLADAIATRATGARESASAPV